MINRPALKYYGGKWKIAPWVISFFPEHQNYVEPCGGAASVLLRKNKSPLETYNDIDFRVVNFFSVLREHPNELIQKIRLTPWSRVEFEQSRLLSCNPVEDARRFFVCSWQSFSFQAAGTWRVIKNYSTRPRPAGFDMMRVEHLYAVAERLQNVQLENRDALDVIKNYDGPNTLIYFDPPYLKSTRVHKDSYNYEVDENFHEKAAEILNTCRSFVVLSGYKSPEYKKYYEDNGWYRFDISCVCNAGA